MSSNRSLLYPTELKSHQIEERLGVEALAVVIVNFDSDGIE